MSQVSNPYPRVLNHFIDKEKVVKNFFEIFENREKLQYTAKPQRERKGAKDMKIILQSHKLHSSILFCVFAEFSACAV